MFYDILAYMREKSVRIRTNHDQPLWLLDTVLILLGVSQCLDLDVLGLLDLVGGSVANEDWLSSPLDDDLFQLSTPILFLDIFELGETYVLSLRDGGKVDLNLSHGQNIRRCGHVD